jgi:hypothetical protein
MLTWYAKSAVVAEMVAAPREIGVRPSILATRADLRNAAFSVDYPQSRIPRIGALR